MDRVREDDENFVHTAITLAFANPPDAFLKVPDARLDFYTGEVAVETKDEIPASAIAWVREQDFMCDGIGRACNKRHKSFDGCLLTTISERVAKRAEACREVQSEHRANLAKPRHGNGPVAETLEPTYFSLRPAKLGSDGLLAQPRRLARDTKFIGKAPDKFIATAPPALYFGFTGGHRNIVTGLSCLPIGRGLPRR